MDKHDGECADCEGSGRCWICDDLYPANENCEECGKYAGTCRTCSGTGMKYQYDEDSLSQFEIFKASDGLPGIRHLSDEEWEAKLRAQYERLQGMNEWQEARMANLEIERDNLRIDVERLQEIAEWAVDADHHPGCSGGYVGQRCKCGRRELFPVSEDGNNGDETNERSSNQ